MPDSTKPTRRNRFGCSDRQAWREPGQGGSIICGRDAHWEPRGHQRARPRFSRPRRYDRRRGHARVTARLLEHHHLHGKLDRRARAQRASIGRTDHRGARSGQDDRARHRRRDARGGRSGSAGRREGARGGIQGDPDSRPERRGDRALGRGIAGRAVSLLRFSSAEVRGEAQGARAPPRSCPTRWCSTRRRTGSWNASRIFPACWARIAHVVLAAELTKIFEEIHRCPLSDALGWLRENPDRQRGEFVLIAEGARPGAGRKLGAGGLRRCSRK